VGGDRTEVQGDSIVNLQTVLQKKRSLGHREGDRRGGGEGYVKGLRKGRTMLVRENPLQGASERLSSPEEGESGADQ